MYVPMQVISPQHHLFLTFSAYLLITPRSAFSILISAHLISSHLTTYLHYKPVPPHNSGSSIPIHISSIIHLPAMAFRTSLRRAPTTAAAFARPLARRQFHSTPRAFVKAGDAVPNLEVLHEDSPGNKVNLAKEFASADGVVVGVPAAFSPGCSQKHVPGYIQHPKLKEAGKVFVVSVNDAFVMKAWADQLDPTKASGIRFLGDPSAQFTKALDLGFDGSAIFGGVRGKRYALVIKDGKVQSAHVEPDNTGTNVSLAEKVLG
ncbi:Redoxin-domain-containing protein [Whalleya microplaca]|nr:Redoxin-domain-containing protein [Whalleya microplaca]